MSDVVVTGSVIAGGQQQWFTRNADFDEWTGGAWNMVCL